MKKLWVVVIAGRRLTEGMFLYGGEEYRGVSE